MKIISVLNEKGGTGKSTVATNLATALHREGKRVVLLDCDPQGTARDWRDASPEDADLPPVLGVDRPQMLASSLSGINAEIAIIDSPAKAESMSAAIVRASHVALLVYSRQGLTSGPAVQPSSSFRPNEIWVATLTRHSWSTEPAESQSSPSRSKAASGTPTKELKNWKRLSVTVRCLRQQ